MTTTPALRTAWERHLDGATHYIQVTRTEVVVGHHYGSGQTDYAGVATHAEFLAGRYQDIVRDVHGEAALTEVLASVRATDLDPAVIAARAAVAGLRAALDAIPHEPGLLALLRDPATEHGRSSHGNRGGYRTRVESDSLVLEIDGREGTLGPLHAAARTHRRVRLAQHASRVVALRDHFLLVTSDDWLLLGPDGEPQPAGRDGPAFGTHLRVDDVHRHGDALLVSYHWFDRNDGGSGVLRLVPGVGFVGRDE